MDSEEILSIQYDQDVYYKIDEISKHISQTIDFCKQKSGELKSQGDSYSHIKFFTYLNELLEQRSNDLLSAIDKKRSELLVRNQEGLPIVDIHEEVDEDGNILRSDVKPQNISSVTDYADVIRSLPGFGNPKETTTSSKSSDTELPETRIEELPAEGTAASEISNTDEQVTEKNGDDGPDRLNTSQSRQQLKPQVKAKSSPTVNKIDSKQNEKKPEYERDEKKNKSLFKKGFLSNPKSESQDHSKKVEKAKKEELEKQRQIEKRKMSDVTDNNAVKETVTEKPVQKSNNQKQSDTEPLTNSKPQKKMSKFKEAKLQRLAQRNQSHSDNADNSNLTTDITDSSESTKFDIPQIKEESKEKGDSLGQAPASTESDTVTNIDDDNPIILPVPTDAEGQSMTWSSSFRTWKMLANYNLLYRYKLDKRVDISLNFSRNLVPPLNPNYFGEDNVDTSDDVARSIEPRKENLAVDEAEMPGRHVHFADTLEIKHVSRNGKSRIENVPTPTEDYDNMFEPHEYGSRISAFRKNRSKMKSQEKNKGVESSNNVHKEKKLPPFEETVSERSSSDHEEKPPTLQNEENLVEKYLNETPTMKSNVFERQPSRSVEQAKEDFEDHQEFVKDGREISHRYYELRRKILNPELKDVKEEEGVVPVDENGNERPKLSKFMAARLGGKL
ncbi:uncharacterized protein SOCG_03750 [Schizosaccharomyces octosporus yFS286]|uniref:Fungal protein n=1 Tax=Schizosaccharomyces octosporus (strain yFS286) TaxID=483514 RepID=S9RCG8_SCHOY|nr:uncharacterized protein SOCG_03750 [Schizosaccharomyces octosporus yFS286]EPX71814.1 fungal protein [Schizosaccharomyces octosporus yFS286]